MHMRWLSLALLALTAAVRAQDVAIPEIRDDVAPGDRAAIERSLRRSAGVEAHGVDEAAQYTFFPMGGIPNVDLLFVNAVDLDPAASSVRDFNCNEATYDGHQGHDMLMLTFRQQDIGTPVYAVSDGTVVAVRDGEPDRNTAWVAGTPSNFVAIRHGPRTTYYFHLRRGSVAVSVNQAVTAGTQLGLAASSGISNWPHLHFESRNATSFFEPSAGPCRPGPSFWREQPPIGGELIVHELAMSPQRFDSFASLPEDPAPRTGTYVRGTSVPVNFRIFLGSVPAFSSYRIRVLRPNGSAAYTQEASMNNPRVARFLTMTRALILDLTTEGKWTVVLDVNGRELFSAPFEVVASPSLVVNRAPEPIEARLVPPRPGPDDVARCEVVSSLVLEDPDYDVLSYRYEWTVAGHVVRTITSAQLMDALPKGTVAHGDVVTCAVTPSDGQLSGPTATATSLPVMRRRPARH